jgi:predicted ATPase
MFLTRDVEWRNRIVSAFREAGLPEGEQQWGLMAMSAFGPSLHFAALLNLVAIGA